MNRVRRVRWLCLEDLVTRVIPRFHSITGRQAVACDESHSMSSLTDSTAFRQEVLMAVTKHLSRELVGQAQARDTEDGR